MDFSASPSGQIVLNKLKQFMKEEVLPIEETYFSDLRKLDNRWVVLPIIDELKAKAKAQGLCTE